MNQTIFPERKKLTPKFDLGVVSPSITVTLLTMQIFCIKQTIFLIFDQKGGSSEVLHVRCKLTN